MKDDKSFFIIDEHKVSHEVFKITSAQFEQYKTIQNLNICDSIYNQYNVNAFILNNSRVIVQESDNYALYPSIEVLRILLKDYKGPYSREILDGKNPYGKDFPKKISNILNDMYSDFEINPNKLSKTEVLKALDSVVIKNRNNFFIDKYLLSFITLIGQYNIEKFGGNWEMELAKDATTWNPILQINKQKVFFADYIIEDFLNHNQKKPVTEVFETVSDIIRINILGISKRES